MIQPIEASAEERFAALRTEAERLGAERSQLERPGGGLRAAIEDSGSREQMLLEAARRARGTQRADRPRARRDAEANSTRIRRRPRARRKSSRNPSAVPASWRRPPTGCSASRPRPKNSFATLRVAIEQAEREHQSRHRPSQRIAANGRDARTRARGARNAPSGSTQRPKSRPFRDRSEAEFALPPSAPRWNKRVPNSAPLFSGRRTQDRLSERVEGVRKLSPERGRRTAGPRPRRKAAARSIAGRTNSEAARQHEREAHEVAAHLEALRAGTAQAAALAAMQSRLGEIAGEGEAVDHEIAGLRAESNGNAPSGAAPNSAPPKSCVAPRRRARRLGRRKPYLEGPRFCA